MPKYKITRPRYLFGKYIDASPEAPAIIEVPKGTRVDAGMFPVGKELPEVIPHHADQGNKAPDSAAQVFEGNKADATTGDAEGAAPAGDNKNATDSKNAPRASDKTI